MLCDDCKKRPACMHITRMNNNQKIEKHLCEQCAKEYGEISLLMESKFSVHDFLKGLFNNYPVEKIGSHVEKACNRCQMTYSDFSRHGKIGCSSCYSIFGDRLDPLLRRLHGATVHTGKAPKRTGMMVEIKQRMKRLRQELECCVQQEQYEQAAAIRDEIKALEKQLAVENQEGK